MLNDQLLDLNYKVVHTIVEATLVLLFVLNKHWLFFLKHICLSGYLLAQNKKRPQYELPLHTNRLQRLILLCVKHRQDLLL